ncbi:MAG: hypothetical protein OEZ43_19330 [Gammaproteobacteria bacterium]|nr:hypothetical protein [Gammaproteobacteria bacterium]
MGLLGGNYLVSIHPNFRFGLGVYGAVYGERGGFFTGGFESTLHFPLTEHIYFDSGFFVGGGGGGAAPQGGGLMFRPHLDFGLNLGKYLSLGIGYSIVRFPNGKIRSDQATIHVQRSFSAFIYPGMQRQSVGILEGINLNRHRRLFALQINAYFPDRGTPGRDGLPLDSRMDVVGVRWREAMSGRWWGDFETGGAWGGGVDGFAQVFIGSAYEWPLLKTVSFLTGLQLGAAGGGDVHTGGGMLARFNLAGVTALSSQWQFILEAGRIVAVDGEFRAWALTGALAYDYDVLRPSNNKSAKNFEANQLQWADFRLRAGMQRYARYWYGNGRKDSGLAPVPVDQVHLKIDAFATESWFVSGQALAAYDGGAGGYAVGLVGSGLRLSLTPAIYTSAELLVGAAGGGGIAVGGGMIVQPMLGLGYRIKQTWSVELSAGYIHAYSGALDAAIMDLAIGYEFSVPHGKK